MLPKKLFSHPSYLISTFFVLFLLISIPLTIILSVQSERSANLPKAQAAVRDKYKQPFKSNSIWNLPLGANAVNSMVPAGLAITSGGTTPGANRDGGGQITSDDEFIGLNPNDPLKTLRGAQVHVPSTLQHDCSWNGIASFLQVDKENVSQGQPLCLSPGGTPSYQYPYATVNINSGYANGDDQSIRGAHGGSSMSGFGGTIRKGELASAEPIRHALKINLDSTQFISGSGSGYRWPSNRHDANAYDSGACDYYAGKVPQLKMGALLALRPDADLSFITSNYARKIAQALKDYGAYVVDSTCWNVFAFSYESTAEFSDGSAFQSDLKKVLPMLHVVDGWNQSSYAQVAQSNGTQGVGGGTPRVCWIDDIDGTVYPCGGGGDTTAPTVSLTAPTNGATVSGTNVTLSANASDNIGVTQVQFFVNNQSVGSDATSPFSIPWNSTTIANGTYQVFARAFDAAGNQGNSSTISITVNNTTNPPPPPPPLPPPWVTSDIGAVGLAGSASYSNGVFTVSGAGADIWDTTDAFRYVYQDLNGNGSITARITSQTNTDPWAKAGVMIRETTAAGSKQAMMVVTPSNGVAFQFRTATDGITSHVGGNGTVPVWLRLTRNGTTIIGATSNDGQTFTQIGTATISMTSTVKLGLVAHSHNTTTLSQATFASVTVTSGTTTKTGDMNSDGKVDVLDLSYLLSKWGTADSKADINKDGTVSILDLSALLANWG